MWHLMIIFLASAAVMSCGAVVAQSVIARDQGQVKISPEEGLITTTFGTPSGGKVSVFLPSNMAPGETFGGTLIRQLPKQPNSSGQRSMAPSDLTGTTKIEPASAIEGRMNLDIRFHQTKS
jgi:hypothetical protein